MRRIIVLVHRYVGLLMAGFLIIAGLTGTLLVWNDELDAWLNPDLFVVDPPASGTMPMDSFELRERVQAAYPWAQVPFVPLQLKPNRAVPFRLISQKKATQPSLSASAPKRSDNQVFVNPYTGSILGARDLDSVSQGRRSVMPFIYRLHYTLALGNFGRYLFGIIAILWLIDCFAGLYLTLPVRGRGPDNRKKTRSSWWTRWRPSWLIRWQSGSYKVNFDLHRASGLWLWALFFVLAWSSIAFNLHPYYDPIKRAVMPTQEYSSVGASKISTLPRMSWDDALETGRSLMQGLARERGLVIQREESMFYDATRVEYRYAVRTDRDIRPRGMTSVTFDARTGTLRRTWIPTGEASGDTLDLWIKSLHKAEIQFWHLAVQLVVAVSGLACALLAVTGIVIWWRKRRSRQFISSDVRHSRTVG